MDAFHGWRPFDQVLTDSDKTHLPTRKPLCLPRGHDVCQLGRIALQEAIDSPLGRITEERPKPVVSTVNTHALAWRVTFYSCDAGASSRPDEAARFDPIQPASRPPTVLAPVFSGAALARRRRNSVVM